MYGSVVVGRSNNAITLFVPKAPPVEAAPELKAQVFDFLSDLLHEHRLLFSAAELISAFATIPCNNYAASQEASLIAGSVRAAFFQVANLTGLGIRRLQDSIDLTLLRNEADAIEVKVASGAIAGSVYWIHHSQLPAPAGFDPIISPVPGAVTPAVPWPAAPGMLQARGVSASGSSA
jgi:hypothetical protein